MGVFMLRKVIIVLITTFVILGCEQPTSEIIKEVTTINNIPIIWKGSLPSAPSNPSVGWAYYDTTRKAAFIWDSDSWEILAQDGVSIIWKGEGPAAPANPQLNWAYYNVIDGNSYIYNGSTWDLLAKAGRDGASGILLWLGTLADAPANPQAGWAYHNSTEGVSYIWDGDSWEILVRNGIVWKGASANPPANPEVNWAYYDTTTNKSYIWNGSWQIMSESGNTTVNVPIDWIGSLTSAPLNPQIGWMYYNSVLGSTYIWDGTAWEIVAQNGQDGTYPEGFLITWQGGLASAPSNPQKGWAYYDTDQKKSFIWDGSSWQILAQDGTDGSGGGAYNYRYLYVICYTPEGNYIENSTQSMDTVNFGKTGIGSTIRTTAFQISIQANDGDGLTLTGSPAIQLSGTNADCFSVTQPSTTSTTRGTFITDASITFTPDSLGIKTATITIPNNSPDKPDFSFTITGVGGLWPKVYDGGEGDGTDQITCSVIDNAGNIYFIGYGFELVSDHSEYDWWIKKIDSSGNEITSGWNKKLSFKDNDASSASVYDRPTNAVIDSNNNLYVSDGYYTLKFDPNGTEDTSGWRKNTTSGGQTLYLDSQDNVFIVTSSSITKYSSSGAQLWTNTTFGGSSLAFDSSNNIAVVSSYYTLRHLSSGGTVNWTKTLSSSTPYFYINDVVFDNSGNVYIAGYGTSIINSYSKKDVWIKKYNSSGAEITSGWDKKLDWGHSDDEEAKIIRFNGTDIIVIGQGNDLINGASKMNTWVKKFSTDGTPIYDFVIPDSNNTSTGATLVKIDSNENYYFSSGSSTSALFRKYNSSGVLQNSYLWNSRSPYIIPPSFIMDNANNVYMYGYSSNLVTSVSGSDWIIRKFDSAGNEL
jgi:hypothetical protein